MVTNALALSASAGNLMPVNVKEMSDDHCSSIEKRKMTGLVILK